MGESLAILSPCLSKALFFQILRKAWHLQHPPIPVAPRLGECHSRETIWFTRLVARQIVEANRQVGRRAPCRQCGRPPHVHSRIRGHEVRGSFQCERRSVLSFYLPFIVVH